MTVKIKNKKILGLILAIYLLFQLFSLVLSVIGVSGRTNLLLYIRYIPLIILAVSFFIGKERIHNIVMGISFFFGCLFEIITIIQLHRSIPFAAVFYLIIYGLIGFSIVWNNSNKKISIVFIFIFAMLTLCFECISRNIISLLIRTSTVDSYITVSSFVSYSVFGFIELIVVVIDMLSNNPLSKNNSPQGIAINNELINFKDLLLFIENEYKSGKISEQEYNRKRNGILSKL